MWSESGTAASAVRQHPRQNRIHRRRRWEEEIPSYPGMGPTEPLLAGNLRVLASASMSIDYYGHCSSPIGETQKRIAFLRRKNPNWFGGMMELTDARPLAKGGVEIAREFGIK